METPRTIGLDFSSLLTTASAEFQTAVQKQMLENDGLPQEAIIAGCLLAGACKAIEANNQKIADDLAGLQQALETLVSLYRANVSRPDAEGA